MTVYLTSPIAHPSPMKSTRTLAPCVWHSSAESINYLAGGNRVTTISTRKIRLYTYHIFVAFEALVLFIDVLFAVISLIVCWGVVTAPRQIGDDISPRCEALFTCNYMLWHEVRKGSCKTGCRTIVVSGYVTCGDVCWCGMSRDATTRKRRPPRSWHAVCHKCYHD